MNSKETCSILYILQGDFKDLRDKVFLVIH